MICRGSNETQSWNLVTAMDFAMTVKSVIRASLPHLEIDIEGDESGNHDNAIAAQNEETKVMGPSSPITYGFSTITSSLIEYRLS